MIALNPTTYQTAPVTCPNCSNRFASPVLTLIDAGLSPETKSLLLAGQLNVAVCPQCGQAGMLNTPLVYHDPEKELLLTYVPHELGIPEVDQQRIIGDITNRLMSTLPAEQRKGYLLRPRSVLRLEGMIEAILEADGITPEMLEAQRARANLLDQLMRTEDEDALRSIVQENETLIDYEFFQLLTLNIEVLQAEGGAEPAGHLLALRRQLLEWTSAGRDVASREEAIKELGSQITREELLEKLVVAALADQQAKIETMVAYARPSIDYVFYQQLTGRIETAEQAGKVTEAETLVALRESILNLTAEIDAEVQRASEQSAQLLKKILQSDDLEQALRANINHIDDLFLSMFAMSVQAAERSGRSEDAEKLNQLGDILMQVITESQPPEIQLVNELLLTEYPEGTQTLLEENQDLINAQFLEIVRMVGEDLTKSGRQEVAQRLAQIQEQVVAMIE